MNRTRIIQWVNRGLKFFCILIFRPDSRVLQPRIGKRFPGGVHWLCRFIVALCESDPVQGIESDTLFQRMRSGQEDVMNILKGVIMS